MARSTFSGYDVVKVLVNVGNFVHARTAGDHVQLVYDHPTNEGDHRRVTVPLHDELRIGTLRDIAHDAGANDFDAFCEWIDRTGEGDASDRSPSDRRGERSYIS